MSWYLRRQGNEVNRKRVQRLMRLMGLEAIYPKRNLSRACKGAKHYPYLLRGLEVNRPDQVWAADITYIRLMHGYLYLVAVLDWYSRYVLAWETSNTLDADFCVVALRRALKYEELYLREHEHVIEATEGIGGWFGFYNPDRPHQGLGDRTPAKEYLGRLAKRRTLQAVSR
jgi:transposase InsO family protein